MLRYLSADIICSVKLTVPREQSSRKTVSCEEQIMSKQGQISKHIFAPDRGCCLCPCKILTEISPRSRRESRRVFGRQDCRDLCEIAAWSLDLSSQKFAKILAEISAAKNSLRFSLRSWFSARSQNLTEILAEILTKISARSPNLGGEKLTEILAEIPTKISGWSQNLVSKISARFQVRSRQDSHRVSISWRSKKTSLRNLAILPRHFTCKKISFTQISR